ncbi:diacylglycerol kinase family lipid kinase [soil metagenome]
MTVAPSIRSSRIFVLLNPGSGGCSVEEIQEVLGRHFPCDNGTCEVHYLADGEDLTALVREAIGRGANLIIAAGGDGTVSAVASGLIGSEARMGILPLGTANVLARELGLPLDPEEGCRLLASAGRQVTTDLDMMQIGDRHYFTQVGVGIDALMIRDTRREDKKRFGRAAYLWTALTRLAGFQPRRFLVEVDGQKPRRFRASEVLVANVGTLGQPPFRWGPDIRPDDGELTVCVIRARSALDYLRVTLRILRGDRQPDPHVRYLDARRRVGIAMVSKSRPLPVQADGEIIGETPVEVVLVPGAVRVVVPPKGNESR